MAYELKDGELSIFKNDNRRHRPGPALQGAGHGRRRRILGDRPGSMRAKDRHQVHEAQAQAEAGAGTDPVGCRDHRR